MRLKEKEKIGNAEISRAVAEYLNIPIYSAKKHKLLEGDFFVDFTKDCDSKLTAIDKMKQDPIEETFKERNKSKLGSYTISEEEAKEKKIFYRAKPHKVEGEIFIDFTNGEVSTTRIKKRKPDVIDEIKTYRTRERLKSAITLQEAKKKHIPIYRAKPHGPLPGKMFVDFTTDIGSPSKVRKSS